MQQSDIFLQNNYILGAPLDMSAAISTNGQINSSSAQMDNDGFTTSTPIPSVQDGFLPQTVPPLTSYMFKLTMLSHGGQALSNNSIPTLSCELCKLMLSALDTHRKAPPWSQTSLVELVQAKTLSTSLEAAPGPNAGWKRLLKLSSWLEQLGISAINTQLQLLGVIITLWGRLRPPQGDAHSMLQPSALIKESRKPD